jgi:hypothetical protein
MPLRRDGLAVRSFAIPVPLTCALQEGESGAFKGLYVRIQLHFFLFRQTLS